MDSPYALPSLQMVSGMTRPQPDPGRSVAASGGGRGAEPPCCPNFHLMPVDERARVAWLPLVITPLLAWVQGWPGSSGVWILLAHCRLPATSPARCTTAALLIDPQGQLASCYDKLHSCLAFAPGRSSMTRLRP